MNDNDDTNNVVHLITNNEEVEEISAEEKSRQSVVEVLEEMLELAKAGDIKEFVFPSEIRTGVRNFLSNLSEPWTSINSALQEPHTPDLQP